MSINVTVCPEDGCDETVAIPDNGVRLDYPATPHDPDDPTRMSIMQLGTMHMACSVEPSAEISHKLHEHQPPEHS